MGVVMDIVDKLITKELIRCKCEIDRINEEVSMLENECITLKKELNISLKREKKLIAKTKKNKIKTIEDRKEEKNNIKHKMIYDLINEIIVKR